MATVTSQVRAVIGALYDALALRAGLSDVTRYRYTPGGALPDVYIVVATSVTGAQQYPAATNRLKYDAFSINGQIFVRWTGTDDDAADAAFARVEELLAEVEDTLRSDPTLGRTGRTVAQLTDYEHTIGGNAEDRQQLCAFTVEVQERMVSS